MRRLLTITLCLALALLSRAESWESVKSSGLYYYGEATADTEEKAKELALAELIGMIATHVSSDFTQIDDIANRNGSVEHKERVLMCVKTYSQATLTGVESLPPRRGQEGVTVMRYILKSKMEEVFDSRMRRANDMVERAEKCLDRAKVDMALQYYYWAYSLVRSLQYPNKAVDARGRLLIDEIPARINAILSDIDVEVEGREGADVDLLFNYKGKPVGSLMFTYFDGRMNCPGSQAKDGRGAFSMAEGYEEREAYSVAIEYEFLGEARADAEMESVLNAISRRPFAKAQKSIEAKGARKDSAEKKREDNTGVNLKPQPSQVAATAKTHADILGKVIEAIARGRSAEAYQYFSIDGLSVFKSIMNYGSGRIVGTPRITYFKGMNGTTVARGLQMSFTFNKKGIKRTFVEDVTFTFNDKNEIDNVAFGLGQVAENDILCQHTSWPEDTRELLTEFLENYKTAYSLERLDYLERLFSDDAVIIVGTVLKPRGFTVKKGSYETKIIDTGQEKIRYNRYTKDTYINLLRKTFKLNEFVNLRFTDNEIQWLNKFQGEEVYAIQIGQEYNSSRYSDFGYLFLLVDMTDHDKPQIKVRTWQPDRVLMSERYNAGDFFK